MHDYYVKFVACKFKQFLPICSQISFIQLVHQEDDMRLGVTWPRLPSHAKSCQVTQAPQLPQLCRTWPKKRVPGQIWYQDIPRHPNSTDLSDFSDLAKTPQFEVKSVNFLVLDQDTPRWPSSHPKTQREGPNSQQHCRFCPDRAV